jgi:hypothetical protein
VTVARLSMLRQLDTATLRAAWWTLVSVRSTRKALRTRPVGDVVVARPPRLPAHAGRGVHAVLKRVPNTCLERALVLQRWLAEHGTDRDVVVGVTGRSDFRAHAWLDGERVDADFQELTRLGPPAR